MSLLSPQSEKGGWAGSERGLWKKQIQTPLYLPWIHDRFLDDCACLFSKRNTDITSNIAKA